MVRKQIGIALLIGLIVVVFMGWRATGGFDRLVLQEVRMSGIKQTRVAYAMAALAEIGVVRGSRMLEIDLNAVQRRMERLPWVRSVWVKRRFPALLMIRVVEKVAVALGREKGRIMLLDEYGVVIKPFEVDDPLVGPVIVPAQRADQAAQVVSLLNLLAHHDWLRARLSEAVGALGGRWTLYTKKGVKLLFSKHMDQEITLLKRLQNQYAILDRKVRQVELRIPGRVAVRAAL